MAKVIDVKKGQIAFDEDLPFVSNLKMIQITEQRGKYNLSISFELYDPAIDNTGTAVTKPSDKKSYFVFTPGHINKPIVTPGVFFNSDANGAVTLIMQDFATTVDKVEHVTLLGK